MAKHGTPPPPISYFASMTVRANGELVCQMHTATFEKWVDACLEKILLKDMVKKQLKGFCYDDFTDRWSAMCLLAQNGISLQAEVQS